MKKRLLVSTIYMSVALLLCGTLTFSWFITKNNVTNIIQTNGDINIESVNMTFYKFLPGNSNNYPFYVDRYLDENGIVISNTISLDKNNQAIGSELLFDSDENFSNAGYSDTSMPTIDNIDVDVNYPFSLGVYDPYLQFVYGSEYTDKNGSKKAIDYHTRLIIKVDVEINYKHNFDFALNLIKNDITLEAGFDDLSKYISFAGFSNNQINAEYTSNRNTYNGITDYYNSITDKNNVEFDDNDEKITIFSCSNNKPTDVISFYIFADYNKEKIYEVYKGYNKESLTTLAGGYTFEFEAIQSEIWEGEK